MFSKQSGHACGRDCSAKLPPMYFDKNGEAITRETYEGFMADMAYLMVGFDRFEDIAIDVCTVWRGRDYRLGLDPEPQIFETTVSESGSVIETMRFSTLQQAEDGHVRASRTFCERRAAQVEIMRDRGTQPFTVGVL